MTDGYIELNARSAFSFLEGASLPEELVAAAADFGMPAMALIDRDGVYGAPRFHMAAKKAGIRAHIGAEITCTDGNRYPLLAESRAGYQNLCRLITRMKLRAKKGEGAATLEEFAEYAQGLVCLAPWRPVPHLDLHACSTSSAHGMSTRKCSGISIAIRKPAIRRSSNTRGA